jgi:hypothetical protein
MDFLTALDRDIEIIVKPVRGERTRGAIIVTTP